MALPVGIWSFKVCESNDMTHASQGGSSGILHCFVFCVCKQFGFEYDMSSLRFFAALYIQTRASNVSLPLYLFFLSLFVPFVRTCLCVRVCVRESKSMLYYTDRVNDGTLRKKIIFKTRHLCWSPANSSDRQSNSASNQSNVD